MENTIGLGVTQVIVPTLAAKILEFQIRKILEITTTRERERHCFMVELNSFKILCIFNFIFI